MVSNATFDDLKIKIVKSPLVSPAVFVERIDKDVIEKLMRTPDVLKTYNEQWAETTGVPDEYHHLKRIYQYAFKNKRCAGQLLVDYDFSKKLGREVGRVYPKGSLSLGQLRRKLRGTLTHHLYYDFDMKNAHPTLLVQIFEKNGMVLRHLREYVDKRDEILGEIQETLEISRDRVKNLFLRVLYGGTIRAWMDEENEEEGVYPITNYETLSHEMRVFLDGFEKEVREVIIPKIVEANPEYLELYERLDAENPRSSVASLYAQNIERMALEVAMLSGTGWTRHAVGQRRVKQVFTRDAILCFDGLMLLKDLVGEDIEAVCSTLSRGVKRHLGLDVSFVVKEIDDIYEELNEAGEEAPVSAFDGAVELCEEFLKQFPGYVKSHTDGRLMIYDKMTGHWTTNIGLLTDYVLVHWSGKRPLANEKTGERWGDQPKKLRDALTMTMPSLVRDNDWFEEAVQNNSKGKILLKDGWYDFESDTFHEGFTPEIVFHHKANVRWSDVVDTEVKAKLWKSLARDPAFGDNKTLEAMLHYISRAVAGGNLLGDRRFLMGTGMTTAGKGTLAGALKNAFGNYIEEINADNFCVVKGGSDDEEKRLKFIAKNPYARVVVCSEKPPHPLDATLIKRVSGGDRITARLLYENSKTFIPHFTMIFFNNSVEEAFNKVDEALLVRLRCWRYDKSFREKVEDAETQMPIDTSIKMNLESNPVWARAFFEVLREMYQHPPAEGLSQSLALTKELSNEMDATTSVMSDFVIFSGSNEDFIPTSELRSVFYSTPEMSKRLGSFERLRKLLEDRGMVARPYKKREPAMWRDKRGYFGMKFRVSKEEEEEGNPREVSSGVSPSPIFVSDSDFACLEE